MTDEAGIVEAARRGDEAAFATLSRRHRRELHVHCYRMLASFEDAEDMVQETMLRAWQKRDTYEGRAPFRAWLYRIATNACLDFLERHRREVTGTDAVDTQTGLALRPHVSWLTPYPDRLFEQAVAPDDPGARLIARETIGLAFLVALQLLPPRQRAALILCDVLEWSAKETADQLDSSVAAVNAALQRARAMLRARQPVRSAPPRRQSDPGERAIVEQYVAATERNDAAAIVQLLRDDVAFSMPAEPFAAAGRNRVDGSWIEGGFGKPPMNDWRCRITQANGTWAVDNYLRRPGDALHRAFLVDVLEFEDGLISAITAFDFSKQLDSFALPETLS